MRIRFRPHIARRSLVLGLAVLLALPALGGSLRPDSAHAASQVRAGFFNHSEYPIVQLTVDNQQVVPGLAATIPPKGTLTLGLAAGSHSFAAANGLSRDFTMYTFSGTVTVQPVVLGVTSALPCLKPFTFQLRLISLSNNCVTFNDPTITALLTRFGTNGVWTSNPFPGGDGTLHFNTFTFRADGSYVFAVDKAQQGGNRFMEVSRDPTTQTITFNVGGNLNGIFSETQGVFFMKNDPNGNALEYR